MADLFISDLHLDAARPDITARFEAFAADLPARVDRLFILGDLFEAWIGDDAAGELEAGVAARLSRLASCGVLLFYLHGNRDFLLGRAFAERCGMRLLPDPCVVELGGEATLLSHGDVLCTDDTAYQEFRRTVRNPAWQAVFLAETVSARQAFAARARAASREHQSMAADAIMDVNPDAVRRLSERYGVRRLIHGHTHRPAIHRSPEGATFERIVLGDWYTQGSSLSIDAHGLRLHVF